MIRRLVLIFVAAMLMCFITACGAASDGNDSGTEYEASTAETVKLSVLPEEAELVPFEKFKEE